MTYRRKTTLIPVLLTLAALAATGSTVAQAQNNLSFISSSGMDINTCQSAATACGSFAGAQDRTNDGGTIICVNPGFYGSPTITKSLTIDCLAGGGGAHSAQLTINAPGKNVRLRNLAVNGLGFLGSGLNIVAAASVHLENLLVTSSNGSGVHDHRVGPAKLVISNSSIVANAGAGIVITPASGIIGAVLDNVHSDNNAYGLAVGAGGRVMIKRSVFSWNGTTGIHADAGAVIGINDTLVSHNQIGIDGNGGSNVALSNSDIDSNTTGISGTARSFGNNRLFANSNDGTPVTPFGALSSENGQR